jgi:hypothetical protein
MLPIKKSESSGNPDLPATGTIRVPPAEAASEALERLVSRKNVHAEPGDILIAKELQSGLKSVIPVPWRYRLSASPGPDSEGRIFSSFQHAASEGERLAAKQRTRLLYIEDGTATLLNDYRS